MLNHLLYFRYALAHQGHGAASCAASRAPASSEWEAFERALGQRHGPGPGRARPAAPILLERDNVNDNAAMTAGGPAFLQAAE